MRVRVRHPAVFSPTILTAIEQLLDQHLGSGRLVDPFAGTGSGCSLGADRYEIDRYEIDRYEIDRYDTDRYEIVGVEIEPEWAACHPNVVVGDARKLPFPSEMFDGAFTSPAYGNRMADHHEAKDGSYRRTYRHVLGRNLSAGNSGAMQWGDEYRALHAVAWREVRRVLRPGGVFLLNCKDHIRRGVRQEVTAWHMDCLVRLGFSVVEQVSVPSPGFRYGANHDLRLQEQLVVLRNDRSARMVSQNDRPE